MSHRHSPHGRVGNGQHRPLVGGEQFGEERVQEIVRAHGDRPMTDLMAMLFAAVDAFAKGAPQEDDMTAVLVKREAL